MDKRERLQWRPLGFRLKSGTIEIGLGSMGNTRRQRAAVPRRLARRESLDLALPLWLEDIDVFGLSGMKGPE